MTPPDEQEPGAPEAGAPVTPGPAKLRDPLPIRKIDYLGPMAAAGGWRPDTAFPEVAFSGRSNVGKSSLINALVRRKALARVSKTPGRTREIHFFGINDAFTLVDLPGYGYAKISKQRQAEWKPLIEGYLRGAPALRGVVQLLDVRRDPTDDDLQMFDLLADIGLPTLVCVTKVDKLSKGAAVQAVEALALRLGLDPAQVIPFSAVSGAGRDELAEAVMSLVTADPAAADEA
ncbi:MAG TPA: ribosome biogenesis GTP-binding protein YihA/YsxC [Gemmatimonadaceae bacterium]|nr:ribosome biogenesis GTP-binding protein YihA/YsxC [Gemmatimonadaceae bacterium]